MIDQENRKDGPMTFDEMLEDMEFMLEASRFNDSVQWNPDMRTTALEKAIELLKTLEPRVMKLGELRECVTYWIEDETGHVVPETIMDITGKDIMTIPVVHLTNGYAPIITKTTDGYNSKRFTGWRCWTSRPTDEQVAATPWEEQHHA